jgi:type I restriction enzyme S subunit
VDEQNIIRRGDFLISRANTLELVGAPVIVKACNKRLVLSDKVLRLRFLPGLQEWIELCLKSALGRHQIETYASGNQLSMRNISQENLIRIAVPVPPRDELERALELFNSSRSAGSDGNSLVEDGQQTSLKLRQSILNAAFEGRLVEQDRRDEPAGILLSRLNPVAAAPSNRGARRSRSAAVGVRA